MMGSDVLEVAIGLIFVFLLASLICTAIKEGLESLIFRRRSLFLKKALGELLNGPGGDPSGNKDWIEVFYKHPLISSLYLGPYDPQDHKNCPSYIPPAAFASAIMDIVCKEAAASDPACKFNAASPLESFKNCVEKLPAGYLKDSLAAVVNQTVKDFTEVRTSLETWFNHSMDRVTGCYKRHTQMVILCVAVGVTLFLNLNTVQMTRQLLNDSVLRKAIVAQADTYVKDQPAPPMSPNAALQGAAPAASTNTATAEGSTNTLTRQIQETTEAISGLGLPIGWDKFKGPSSFGGWAELAAGWLATMFAISLGAPFWFDMLNKIIQVRGALSPAAAQKRAEAEKPKKSP